MWLRELYEVSSPPTQADELSFARGEAAINVYSGAGGFQPHKDCEALTVLVHLSGPEADYTGGGTGFWAAAAEEDEAPSLALAHTHSTHTILSSSPSPTPILAPSPSPVALAHALAHALALSLSLRMRMRLSRALTLTLTLTLTRPGALPGAAARARVCSCLRRARMFH